MKLRLSLIGTGRISPVGIFVGIVPSVIGGRSVAVGIIWAAAPAARRILALPVLLLVGGFGLWLGLIGPSRWPHVLGEGFLARDASVSVVVVVHHFKSVVDFGLTVKNFFNKLFAHAFNVELVAG